MRVRIYVKIGVKVKSIKNNKNRSKNTIAFNRGFNKLIFTSKKRVMASVTMNLWFGYLINWIGYFKNIY